MKHKLDLIRQATKILNGLGLALLIWVLFIHQPYEVAILTTIFFAFGCILLIFFNKGFITLKYEDVRKRPSLYMALFLSSIGLILRSLLDYNIFNYANIWIPCFSLTILLLLIIYVRDNELRNLTFKTSGDLLSVVLFIFGYSYATILFINCNYDKSEPVINNVKVVKMSIDKGKHTSYDIELTPWNGKTENEEVSISKRFYNVLKINDTVQIENYKGLLNIEWFEVKSK